MTVGVTDGNTSVVSVTLVPITTTTTTTTNTTTTTTTTTTPAANGTISFETNPAGAKIYLNSDYKGVTPLTLYNITPATYTVLFQKAEYLDWSERKAVTAGARADMYAKLTPVPTTQEPVITTVLVSTTQQTATTTKKSTIKTPTPWPTNTPTPESAASPLSILGVVGIGIFVLRKR